VDTVIMNPPFGTRRKGADMEFLAAALKVDPWQLSTESGEACSSVCPVFFVVKYQGPRRT
jgi:predicted RNA methylase